MMQNLEAENNMSEIDLPFGLEQNTELFLPNFDKPRELSDSAYNCVDVLVTARAGEKLEAEGATRMSLFDQALMGPSLLCSLRGMRIDHGKIAQAKLEIEERARAGKEKFLALAGSDVKFGKGFKPSPAELARILYRDFKVKTRLGHSDNPSVAQNILVDIRDDIKTPDAAVPIVELALELTALESDRQALEKPAGPDGRIHSSFMISAAVSARWGSRKDAFNEGMNLHGASDLIRKVFIPDPGKVLVALDQSQAESNLVAALSGSKWYLDAHKAGNVHVQSGKVFFPEYADIITKDWAKNTPFPGAPGKDYYSLMKSCQHACCDSETEVLTQNGWISCDNYDPAQKLAVWDYESGISWEIPDRWNTFDYSGPMIQANARECNFLVTPNHRIPVIYIGRKGEELIEREAGEFNYTFGKLPLGGFLRDSSDTVQASAADARLLAATWADGCLRKRSLHTVFGLRKPRKIARIQELTKACGFEPRLWADNRGGNQVGIKGHLRKKLGWDLLLWPQDARDAFLDELKFWDGHESKDGYVQISNTDWEGLEIIATLSTLSNYPTKVTWVQGAKTKKKYGSVQLRGTKYTRDPSKKGHATFQAIRKNVSTVDFSGKVYCPTTSTGWFVIRRMGLISVTGNSNYGQSIAGMAKHLHIPKPEAQKIQMNYFNKVPEIPRYHEWIANEIRTKRRLITPFGRVRQFLGRTWEHSSVREAISYQPQSTVSDITKIFLWRLFTHLDPDSLQILMEHHDSVMFQVDEDKLDTVMPLVHELSYIPFKVGSEIIASKWEAKVGYSWSEI